MTIDGSACRKETSLCSPWFREKTSPLPSGKHTKSYCKLPFIVSFPIKIVIFHRYVCLPRGYMVSCPGTSWTPMTRSLEFVDPPWNFRYVSVVPRYLWLTRREKVLIKQLSVYNQGAPPCMYILSYNMFLFILSVPTHQQEFIYRHVKSQQPSVATLSMSLLIVSSLFIIIPLFLSPAAYIPSMKSWECYTSPH